MKFTVFRKEFTPAELRKTPELCHLRLSVDRKTYWGFVGRQILGVLIILAAWQLIAWPLMEFNAPDWVGMGWYVGVPIFGIWYAMRVAPQTGLNYLHRQLRARNIYYCPASKCRYNCTGIRGNICPECGATVPGLTPEAPGPE